MVSSLDLTANTKSEVPTFPSTLKSGKYEPELVSVGVSQMEQNTKWAKKYRKSSKNQEFAAFLVAEAGLEPTTSGL